MEENLIGYLIGALDERTQQEVEIHLEQHPEARDRLVVLKQALAPLAADQPAPAPPPQLALRTLARIAEHMCDEPAAAEPPGDLPQAPPVSPATLSGGRSWWRRTDVLVAACLLFMVGGLGVTGLNRLRTSHSIAECGNNLQLYSTALNQYRDVRGQFPDITKETPHHVAGMVVPMLVAAGTLPASASIRCPGNGEPVAAQFDLAALRNMSEAEFAPHAPKLSMCYAYSLGYRDENGIYHGPGTQKEIGLSQLPILSDGPPGEDRVSNSKNHGGAGQNVLFADGHVVFLPKRRFGNEDDIFLNNEQKVAAGVGAADIVLGASAARP